MELLCPCGNGPLIKAVTSKGKYLSRPYYTCPGSKTKGIPDCHFYSFEDELKQCPCGRGFCRNEFRGRDKFWCCCCNILGDSCGFREKIVRIWQPPSWLSQSHSAQSQSSQSQSSRSLEVTPSHTHAALEVSSSGGASSSYAPESSNSQVSPSRRTNELLLKALKVTREKEAIYLDIIKDLTNVSLDD